VKKLWWGLLDAAKEANANIVPVAIQLVGDTYGCIIGERFTHENFPSKAEQIDALRNEMATLAWELIEMSPPLKREDISDDYWLARVQDSVDRTRFITTAADIAEEESYTFRPPGEISLGELLAEMHGIEYRSMGANYATHRQIERLIDGWTKR